MRVRFPRQTVAADWVGNAGLIHGTPTVPGKIGPVPVTVHIAHNQNALVLKQVTQIETNLEGPYHAVGKYSYSRYLTEVNEWADGELVRRTRVAPTFGNSGVYYQASYSGGMLHGPYKAPSFVEGNYRRGKRHGKWKFYQYGTLLETCCYRGGIPHGYTTYYWTNGNKRCRLHIQNGKVHGWATYWNQDGTYAGARKFRDGQLTKARITNHDNNATEEISGLRLLFDVDILAATDGADPTNTPDPGQLSYGMSYVRQKYAQAVNALYNLEKAYVDPSTNVIDIRVLAHAVS